jgi:hypothetical protein
VETLGKWFPALSCRYAPIKLLMSLLGRLIKGITTIELTGWEDNVIKFKDAKKAIDEYFENVTLEQLNKDLKAAGVDFYAKKKENTIIQSKLNDVLSVVYDELEWLHNELAALDKNPDYYVPGDKPDLTSRQDELQDILKKCNLPLNR